MEVIKLGQKAVNKATDVIKKGGVVVFPTDTVYGLIADATNKRAVEKIFKIKKRPKTKPLAVFVSNIKQAKGLAEISREQEKILKKYWPGKFTFILKKKVSCELGSHKKLYGVDKKTIGIRIPRYKFLNDLLKKIGRPLAQTSANISGQPASTKIAEVINSIATSDVAIDLVIDAGNLPKSKSSIIIDLSKKKNKILRK